MKSKSIRNIGLAGIIGLVLKNSNISRNTSNNVNNSNINRNNNSNVNNSNSGTELEVTHWWTSGGEAAAVGVLKDDLKN